MEALTSLWQKKFSDHISTINIEESPAVLVKNNSKFLPSKGLVNAVPADIRGIASPQFCRPWPTKFWFDHSTACALLECAKKLKSSKCC